MYSRNDIKAFFKSKQFKLSSVQYFLNDAYDLSEKFEDTWLIFAENYRTCLKIESSEFGIDHTTASNAKVRLVMLLTKPIVKEIKNPCGRCDGTGFVPYRHVENGICFKCNGTGNKL